MVQEHKPPQEAGGGARKIPGWDNVEAFQQASAGLAADMAGKLDQCIEYDNDSLKLEEQPRTRLHLSSCERRAGKLIDALRDAQKALESGIQKKDIAVMKAARTRVQDLLLRIPHVTFVAPPAAKTCTSRSTSAKSPTTRSRRSSASISASIRSTPKGRSTAASR